MKLIGIHILRIFSILLCIHPYGVACAQSSEARYVQSELDRIYFDLHNAQTSHIEAIHELELLPRDATIERMITMLETQTDLDDLSVFYTYFFLYRLGAVQSERGRTFLLSRLADLRAGIAIVEAFKRVSTEHIDEVLPGLLLLLQDSSETTERIVATMGTVGHLGAQSPRYASDAFEIVGGIFSNPANEGRIRSSASTTMIRLGGVGPAIDQFSVSDETGKILACRAIKSALLNRHDVDLFRSRLAKDRVNEFTLSNISTNNDELFSQVLEMVRAVLYTEDKSSPDELRRNEDIIDSLRSVAERAGEDKKGRVLTFLNGYDEFVRQREN